MRISDWSSDVCSSDLDPSGWRLWRSQDEMKDLVKTGVWENRTTWQDAVAFAQSDPDGVAIWFDDGSELTYRQGCEEAITLAASLTELSLRKGDVVSANLPNRSEEHTSELQSLMRI